MTDRIPIKLHPHSVPRKSTIPALKPANRIALWENDGTLGMQIRVGRYNNVYSQIKLPATHYRGQGKHFTCLQSYQTIRLVQNNARGHL